MWRIKRSNVKTVQRLPVATRDLKWGFGALVVRSGSHEDFGSHED
ncbi:MAG TPA: hypothetical protein VE944_12395 [Nostoc sp.]|nr:hypothetical protein [Nostoc sp.]HYX15143.1 hypothetical protein [Nostoc sp.]